MIYKKRSKAVAYYPIFFNIQGKRCIVVGGGRVALRKIKTLLDYGGKVTVISPRPLPEIVKLSEERVIGLNQREYEAGDLKGGGIALACTDVKKVNRNVADEARKAGVLVNVADDPKQSDFIIPSFFRRGNLTVAVSTSGVSPAFAKKIRARLEQDLGEEYALVLCLIGEVRSTIREKGDIASIEAWQEALDLDPLVRFAKAGQWKKAKTFLQNKLKAAKLASPSSQGRTELGLAGRSLMSGIKFSGYIPGAIGRIAELHGTYYSKHWGFDLFFESKVAIELSEFLRRFDEASDGFWVASVKEKIVGAIAIDGIHHDSKGAHLRWFIVGEENQGQGIGKMLLKEAVEFCRKEEFGRVYLWTFAGLDPARHLYEKFGFTLCEEHEGSQWGRTVTEQRLELILR